MRSRVMTLTDCGVSRIDRSRPVAVRLERAVYEPSAALPVTVTVGRVGDGASARTRQSGGTQNFVLPASGLGFSVPRLIFQRPSGADTPALVRPDLLLPDSPYDSRQLIDAVLDRAGR